MNYSQDQTTGLRCWIARLTLFLMLPILMFMFTNTEDVAQAAPTTIRVLVLDGDTAGLAAAQVLQAEIQSENHYVMDIIAVDDSTLETSTQMRALGQSFHADAVIWQSGASLQVELLTTSFQRALAQVQ